MALDEEGGKNFFNHVMSLWIAPEIKRRKENGILTDNFAIDKIQILINHHSPWLRLKRMVTNGAY
jgi:hypothetical protein